MKGKRYLLTVLLFLITLGVYSAENQISSKDKFFEKFPVKIGTYLLLEGEHKICIGGAYANLFKIGESIVFLLNSRIFFSDFNAGSIVDNSSKTCQEVFNTTLKKNVITKSIEIKKCTNGIDDSKTNFRLVLNKNKIIFEIKQKIGSNNWINHKCTFLYKGPHPKKL